MDKRRRKRSPDFRVIVICIAAAYLIAGSAYSRCKYTEPAVSEIEEMSRSVSSSTYAMVETQSQNKVFEADEQEGFTIPDLPENAIDIPEGDEYLLARIAMAEAEDEDTEGKALVVCVVMNRVADSEFPDTVEGVIFQKHQFSPISNGRWDRVEPNDDCYEAVRMVEEGWDESRGATYFESESSSTWHRDNLEFLFQHGCHYFYSDKE